MTNSEQIALLPAFIGAKCAAPIPVGIVPPDVLVQASLDPLVTAIDFVATVHVPGHELNLDGVVIETASGHELLHVHGWASFPDLEQTGSRLLAMEHAGLSLREIPLSEIWAEPRRGDARTVWRCRHVLVPDTISKLIDSELSARSLVPLGDLVSLPGLTIESIYALACRNRLWLELSSGPLGFNTIVRAAGTPIADYTGQTGRSLP